MRHLLPFICVPLVYAAAPAPVYQKNVRPPLVKYCGNCHNPKLKTGNVDLVSLADPKTAAAARDVWEGVGRRLKGGTMPPKGLPRPTAAETAGILAWIQANVRAAAAPARPEPGRVTARRLNKYEYNRTVEDLLAVRFQPADDFPADDSGYGFDNIGDVLSLSPVLMEKYLAAAERISRAAIGGGPAPRVAVQRYRNSRAPRRAEARHRFFLEAEYDLRGLVAGRRVEGAAPASAVLLLDGREVRRFELDVRTDRPRTLEARVRVTGGDHQIVLEVPADDYDGSPAALQRNLAVDYIEVRGPYPAAGPTESQKRVFVCGHEAGAHERGCTRQVAAELARRAWRRPVSDAELEPLLSLAALAEKQGDSVEDGMRLALEAILVSPHFLFRIERDPGPSAGPVHRLGDFELASRLSYFLWSSLPDDALFAAAQSGELRRPEGLRAQVRRMLADAKSSRLVENFGGQWLELRNLESLRPDPKRFPEFDEPLRLAMRQETTHFFESLVREDRPLTDFLDAPYTYLNQRLARHYGIDGVEGAEFRRVELRDQRRGGILTHASVLAVSSYPTRTSPVLRGKYLLENILGEPPPPPPPDVPALDEKQAASAGALRAQLEQHRSNAICASCHDKMDPLGFAFENYDAVGRFRTHDGEAAIDASGILPDGKKFQGAAELKKILRGRSDAFARCLTEKLLTYALGRGLERYDRPTVEAICRKMAQTGYRFSTLAMEIAESPPFLMKRRESVAP